MILAVFDGLDLLLVVAVLGLCYWIWRLAAWADERELERERRWRDERVQLLLEDVARASLELPPDWERELEEICSLPEAS